MALIQERKRIFCPVDGCGWHDALECGHPIPDSGLNGTSLVGNETHPGWWLHKILAFGRPGTYFLVRTYYPTSIPNPNGDGEGDVLARFRLDAERATDLMLAAADREPDRVWGSRELRAIAGGGTAAAYALCRLANPEYDGRLELTPSLDVRRAR